MFLPQNQWILVDILVPMRERFVLLIRIWTEFLVAEWIRHVPCKYSPSVELGVLVRILVKNVVFFFAS